ncbi:MAG: hypothetical protein V4510_04505 [bacterium]
MAIPPLPWGPLRFLYVGTKDTSAGVKFWTEKGARKVWHFKAFGAEVAALEIGPGPLLLLADHRPAGHVLPIYEVPDMEKARKSLVAAGWKPEGPTFEVPHGPVLMLKDPSGIEVAILEDRRPGAMESSYSAENPNAQLD